MALVYGSRKTRSRLLCVFAAWPALRAAAEYARWVSQLRSRSAVL